MVFEGGVHLTRGGPQIEQCFEEVLVGVWGLAGHGDVVGLHVEDENVRLVLGDCRRLEELGGVHMEEAAEHSVHSGEGQGHTAGSAQETAPVHAEAVAKMRRIVFRSIAGALTRIRPQKSATNYR